MSWQKETPSECKCSWWSSSLLSTAPPYYQHLNLPPVDKLKSLDFQKFYKLLPEICFFFLLTYCPVLPLTGPNLAHCLCCGKGNDWEHPMVSANTSLEVRDSSSIVGGKHHITVTLTADIQRKVWIMNRTHSSAHWQRLKFIVHDIFSPNLINCRHWKDPFSNTPAGTNHKLHTEGTAVAFDIILKPQVSH